MIDFNYTAPELLPLRIQEVLYEPNEPHRIGGIVYVPEHVNNERIAELETENEQLRMAKTLLSNSEQAKIERIGKLESLVRDMLVCLSQPAVFLSPCGDCSRKDICSQGLRGFKYRAEDLGIDTEGGA